MVERKKSTTFAAELENGASLSQSCYSATAGTNTWYVLSGGSSVTLSSYSGGNSGGGPGGHGG